MAEQAQKQKLKTTFKVKGEDGVEREYAVRRPSPKEMADGQKVFNKAWREALDNKAIVGAKLDSVLREQGLWDDAKQAEADRLAAEIMEGENTLRRKYRNEGGRKVNITLAQARDVAIGLRRLRFQREELFAERGRYDNMTADAQASDARMNFFASRCIVDNDTGTAVYKDVDDYLEHASDPVAFQGASHLFTMLLGGTDPDWRRKLPENEFLLKYHFVDDKLRLINEGGRLIDAEGRLINEEGRYVNEKNEFVNKQGQRIDDEGRPVFEDAEPFFADEQRPSAGPEAAPQ